MAMIAIGIGCTSSATVTDIKGVMAGLDRAIHGNAPASCPIYGMAASGAAMTTNVLVAALERGAIDNVIRQAVNELELAVIFLKLEALKEAAGGCVSHSEKSMARYGVPSVAEAAALAAAGPGAKIFLPRLIGRNATAAMAIGE